MCFAPGHASFTSKTKVFGELNPFAKNNFNDSIKNESILGKKFFGILRKVKMF